MTQRKSFVPVSWVAGSHAPRAEDVNRRIEFIRTRKARAKQRVNEEFPPVKLAVS
jgi:hypothetical protein